MSEPSSPEPASTESRQTPLRDIHVELGARMIDFAGWDMPVWYAGATEEHHAVRSAAGLFDLSHMAELFVSGVQAGPALDYSLLVEASAMPVGRARYTMIVNEDGGIIDDLIVYRLAEDHFMVVANASNGPAVSAALDERCQGFDAELSDRTDEFALIAVQGPQAEAIVTAVTDPALVDLRYYRVAQPEILGLPAMAARTGYTGEDGFELFVPAEIGHELWRLLTERGADGGLVPVGLAARDTLRLEAGMPLYGNELGLDTTPYDVGSARLVTAKTEASVGANALAAASTKPSKSLIGLQVDGRRPARTGYNVSLDGSAIGTVTSGALSPTLGYPIAIARVDRAVEVGASVAVDVRGTEVIAVVIELPFYRRSK